jgi:hypothetical protein
MFVNCEVMSYSVHVQCVPGQEVTKRCLLSWLTNSALVYEPKCAGGGGGAGSQPIITAVKKKF